RRPLEDVEQLAERDVEQTEDDGQGVKVVEEAVVATLQPQARRGEEETGDRHREEPGECEEVTLALHGEGSGVTEAAVEEHEDARDHQEGGDVEQVEGDEPDDALRLEGPGTDAEEIGPVLAAVLADRLEMHPAEGERERDRGRQDATPEDELVRRPADGGATAYEPLGQQVGADQADQADGVSPDTTRSSERFPAPLVEAGGRRPLKPDHVAVDGGEHAEQDADQVAGQGGVQPLQPAAAAEGP